MANKKDILEILGLISVAFPNFKMAQSGDVSTADAYMAFLGDLPADILKVSVLKCCSESGRAFAPSVGEIRGTVGEIQRKAQNIPSTLEAWDEVCAAPKPSEYKIMRGGEWHDPPVYQWSHPLVEKIAKQFGWPNFPKYENESTDRAHFFKHYETALQDTTTAMIELPQVSKFIESNDAVKQLADGMRK